MYNSMYMTKLKNKMIFIKMISQIKLGLLAKIIKIGTVSDIRGKAVEKLSDAVLKGAFLLWCN